MTQDTFTQRVAAVGLVVALLAIIGGVIYLAANDKTVESALTGALGLIVGALLPSPISKSVAVPPDVNITTTGPDPEATAMAVARRLQAPKRGRGQAGEMGCMGFVVAAAGLVVLALIVWAIVS